MGIVSAIVASGVMVPRLKFGQIENVIVRNVDCEVRRVKGVPVDRNTFITIDEVNPDTRKVISSQEFSFFKPNLEQYPDFAYKSFVDQMLILAGIVNAIGGDAEEFELDFEDSLAETLGEEVFDNLEKAYVSKKKIDKKMPHTIFLEALQAAFKIHSEGKMGDNCPLLACTVTANKKGFISPKADMYWIVDMEEITSLVKVSNREHKVYNEAMEARNKDRQPEVKKSGDEFGSVESDDDDEEDDEFSLDDDIQAIDDLGDGGFEDTEEEIEVAGDDEEDDDPFAGL